MANLPEDSDLVVAAKSVIVQDERWRRTARSLSASQEDTMAVYDAFRLAMERLKSALLQAGYMEEDPDERP